MADEEQLRRLRGGVAGWNAWVRKEREQPGHLPPIDLVGADLSGLDLKGAELEWARLDGAVFVRATLEGANLQRAILRSANLGEANLHGANLSRAELSEANLRGAILSKATLERARLRGQDLRDGSLDSADLRLATLQDATLGGADLRDADRRDTDLRNADFTGANLFGVDLGGANLVGADFAEARLAQTLFVNVDLSEARNLEQVRHEGPSTIGVDTLFRSKGEIPKVFLAGVGVPDLLVDYLPSLTSTAITYYSCFISHSSKDRPFCERLQADLRNRGIRVWYFPEDARGGRSLWGEIDEGIQSYDKLVVVCSESSLTSGPVLREIERALQREDREGRNILFPIRIDDYLFKGWVHPRRADVVAKVAVDFRGAKIRRSRKYEESLDRLVKDLEA